MEKLHLLLCLIMSHPQDDLNQFDGMHDMLLDVFIMLNLNGGVCDSNNDHIEEPNVEAREFYKLIEDAN